MKLAIIGVTGLVGREMLDVLEERDFFLTDLIPVASQRSCGQMIKFKKRSYKIISLEELLYCEVDLALFSAGADVSKVWAPKLSAKGIKVIDNSSFWRMSEKHKLIVPEVNGQELNQDDMIISNPNCSTIQLVMALASLHKKFIVKRAVISTYQAVSGTGKKAVEQLNNETKNIKCAPAYSHQIFNNVLPHCDDFTENGYTKEEMKLTNETKKILCANIDIVATAVRVPVIRGHSESINVTFEKEFDIIEARHALTQMPGLEILDRPSNNEFPMPLYCRKKDCVYVGRIRKDFTQPKTLNMWVVADNLRKGAATNTIQIAEYLISHNLL